jgi:hypothetical protein
MLRSLLCALLVTLLPATARADDQSARLRGTDVVQAMLPCLRQSPPLGANDDLTVTVRAESGGAYVRRGGEPWLAVDDWTTVRGDQLGPGFMYYFGTFVPDIQGEPLVLVYRYDYAGNSLMDTLGSRGYLSALTCFDQIYPVTRPTVH